MTMITTWKTARMFATLLLLCGALAFAEDWPKYRHDLNNSGANGESTTTTSNVASLYCFGSGTQS